MKAKFYDPHPGISGCIFPLPESVRLLANQLSGQEMTIDDAVAKIQKIAGTGYEVTDCQEYNFIQLKESFGNSGENSWRVIMYRPIITIEDAKNGLLFW